MNAKNSFEYLLTHELIEYGQEIPAPAIIRLIGRDPEAGWAFLGPFLALKEYIESQGYFCTSADCKPGGLRILPLVEMTDRVENVQRLLMRRQKKALTTMLNCEPSELSEYERERHRLATTKLTLGLQALKSVICNVG